MNRFYLYFIGSLALLLSIVSCQEAVEWEFQPGSNGNLAVESIITDEFKHQEIKLSLSFDDLNGQAIPVSGATVMLSDGLQSFLFEEVADQSGKYLSMQSFAAQLQRRYQLEIEWEEQTYLAESEMVEILPIRPMQFDTVGTDSFSIKEVGPLYASNEQAMYEVDIDWNHITPDETSRAKQFFYTLSTVDANELFRPPTEKIIFPKGSNIIEKKYALNPEFATYIRTFLMETAWQGGVYDENSSSLPTNISNGGIGFFAVAAVRSDTLIAE